MPSEEQMPYFRVVEHKRGHDDLNDLTENEQKDLKKCYNQIATVRQKAQKLCQSKGLLATTSLVLCSDKRTREELIEVKETVERWYSALNGLLKTYNLPEIGAPTVKPIPLIEIQFVDMAELSKAKLIETLNSSIERVTELLKADMNEIPEDKRKTMTYRLEHERRELAETKRLASEIGIDVLQTDTLDTLLRQTVEKAKH